MTNITHLLAEAAAPAAAAGSPFGMLPLMLIMFGLFYFVLIRPQRKAQKEAAVMRDNLRVGDKVVTIGGMHGLVSGKSDKTVSVKIADGLSVKFDRSAIATVNGGKASKDSKAIDNDSSDEESDESDS
ncbi:preprotein translocase subunit YajC [Verrucomicrobiales bacterium]|nr:preprotein translocase subunit YajC [Verrucomicrobiales bacterium]|tara:strand:+ start:300 stop:683 length:384 start_codon:yes stop_codon:yes gene_type:complete